MLIESMMYMPDHRCARIVRSEDIIGPAIAEHDGFQVGNERVDAMQKAGERKGKTNTRKIVNGLLNYSLAAAATVAMAQPVQAAVVQSGPQFITLNHDGCSYIDLNGDMIEDFAFCLYSYAGFSYGVLFSEPDNAAMLYSSKYTVASRLCSEEVPGDTDSFDEIAVTHVNYAGYRYGQFSGKNGSIGLRFEIPNGGSETHYGYIRLWASAQGDQALIKDWAYEDVPDTSILTPPCGEVIRTDTDPTTVPTLNQWGILILMGLILLEGGRRLKKDTGKEA